MSLAALPTPVDEVTDMGTLCATDRCDRCGAQAYVRVVLAGGALDFCAHDYRQSEAGLAATGATVLVDDRHRLAAKPAL